MGSRAVDNPICLAALKISWAKYSIEIQLNILSCQVPIFRSLQGILRDRKREENGEEIEGVGEIADLDKEDDESEEEDADEDIEKKDDDELDDIENEDDVELADLDKEDESEEEDTDKDIENKDDDKLDDVEDKDDLELDDIDIKNDESEEDDSAEDIENKNDDEFDDIEIENDVSEEDDSAEDIENKNDDELNDPDIENDESEENDTAEDIENKDMNGEKIKKKFPKREKKKPISKLDKFRINFGKQTELPVEDGLVEDSIENFIDYAVENNANKLRALILTPTRELAVQIKNHIQVCINLI